MFLDLQGEYIDEDQILGYGGRGVVFLDEGMALKIPFRNSRTSPSPLEGDLKVLRLERNISSCLSPSPENQCLGVVPRLGFSETSIKLAYVKNGDLRTYLQSHCPSRLLQLSWFKQMASTPAHIHERRVLVSDIAMRNFLLDAGLEAKLCDFSEASLLPLETTDMELSMMRGIL